MLGIAMVKCDCHGLSEFHSFSVPPVKPTDLEVNSPLGTRAQITWSLANQIADEAADSLTLTLESPNDIPIFQEYTLPGSQTALDVDVVPGLQYIVRLSSHNVDGITFADPLTVDTPPMRKYA